MRTTTAAVSLAPILLLACSSVSGAGSVQGPGANAKSDEDVLRGSWTHTAPPPPLQKVPLPAPAVTRFALQNGMRIVVIEQHRKPVVVDECCYEGNIPHRWGNITAEEMVRRFWEGAVHGGYVGHGDTFLHPQDILWWARGGVLHGQSAARLASQGIACAARASARILCNSARTTSGPG